MQFIQADPGAAEVRRSTSSGYAVGADIDFPAYASFPKEMPAGGDPAFAAVWGRWEGDNEIGTYIILQATMVRPKVIYFQIGFRTALKSGRVRQRLRGTSLSSSMEAVDGYTTSFPPGMTC